MRVNWCILIANLLHLTCTFTIFFNIKVITIHKNMTESVCFTGRWLLLQNIDLCRRTSEKLITPSERDLSVQLSKVHIQCRHFTIEYIKTLPLKRKAGKLKLHGTMQTSHPFLRFVGTQPRVCGTARAAGLPRARRVPMSRLSRAVLHATVFRGPSTS